VAADDGGHRRRILQELMAWFGAAGAADTCPWDRLDDLAAETTALCCGADGAACPAAATADGGVSTPDACALPCAVAMHDFTTRCGAVLRRLNPQGTGYAVLAAFEEQCVHETEDNGEAVLHALGTAQCPADGEATAPAPAPAATALADGETLLAFINSGNGADFPEIAATWVAGTDPCAANWFGVTCDPAPSNFEAEFYFGFELPNSATAGAIVDDGAGFTTGRSNLDYGWDCDGDTDVDFSGGRRGLARGGGLGLNYFDQGWCPGAVNWNLAVPNGVYNIEVNFGEDSAAAGWNNCANDDVGENALNYLEVEGEIA
jgi:hypothetical protein